MKTEETPTADIRISPAAQFQAPHRAPINDNLILTIIFVLGILGAFYILNTTTSPSTINSQGYTIEFSSAGH